MNNHPEVIHFQRKPRPGFNYSIESIFESIRFQLKNKVQFSVKVSSFFNDGYFTKFRNSIEAACRQKKNAVSHITGEVHFLALLMRKKNTLLTIHDCRFMQRKKGLSKLLMLYLYLKCPVSKSSYIVAVSESTKKDILRFTNCNPRKIYVIPVSVSKIFKPSPKIFNEQKPVILQVGAAPNKNISRLTDAIKEITCRLIIVGNPCKKDIDKLNAYKIQYLVKSNLSAEELYTEYKNCDMVSFVSTFEGFGMPVIEAQAVERAVITSNLSSLPEVAGDGACLVNPYDIEDIKKGIKKIMNDATYRNLIIKKGSENAMRFNEVAIAESYYDLYFKMNNTINS